jgi:hypothetical protein
LQEHKVPSQSESTKLPTQNGTNPNNLLYYSLVIYRNFNWVLKKIQNEEASIVCLREMQLKIDCRKGRRKLPW